MNAIQVAIWRAIENPSDLERGMEDVTLAELAKEVEDAELKRKGANHGLSIYQDFPEGMKGIELFDHAVSRRMVKYADRPTDHKITEGLGIMSPAKGWRQPQKDILNVNYLSVCESNIMADLDAKEDLYYSAD